MRRSTDKGDPASISRIPGGLSRKPVPILVPILAGVLVALLTGMSGALDQLENMSFDLRARAFAGRVGEDRNIVLVYLDQYSLDWAEKELDVTWPWPREMYGLAAEFLASSRSTTFDVLFPEPSSYGVDDDKAFADTIRKAGNVVLAEVPGEESRTGLAPELGLTGVPTGSVVLRPDRDGIFRHYRPYAEGFSRTIPSLGLAALRTGNRGGIATELRTPGPGQSDDLIPRFAQAGKVFRRYNAAEVISSAIGMRNGGKPQLDPGIFRDRFVFFGFSAPGLFDRQATPVSVSAPGVDVHAFFLKSILDSTFLKRIPLWLDHALAACAGLATGLAIVLAKKRFLKMVAAIFGMVLVLLVGFFAYPGGLWIGLVEPELAVFAAIACVFSTDYIRVGRQRTFLKSAFGMYLSPAVIEKLVEKPELLRLGGERREVSVMFTDLAGFTSIAERLDPERLALVLNEYLSAMSEIIFEEGGTIDKYSGDGIIAFWNAPVPQSDHAARALTAAIRCRDRLVALGPKLEGMAGLFSLSRPDGSREAPGADGSFSADNTYDADNAYIAAGLADAAGVTDSGVAGSDDALSEILSRGFRMRIGVHTGTAVVGNLGSLQRFNYTVLGDTVNLASRLEGANKVFGTTILVSGAVAYAVSVAGAVAGASVHSPGGAAVPKRLRHVARISVVGRIGAVEIYEPVAGNQMAKTETFEEARALFTCGEFVKAGALFAGIADFDPVSAAYAGKCASLAVAKPEDGNEAWSGVWVLDSK